MISSANWDEFRTGVWKGAKIAGIDGPKRIVQFARHFRPVTPKAIAARFQDRPVFPPYYHAGAGKQEAVPSTDQWPPPPGPSAAQENQTLDVETNVLDLIAQ